MNTALVTGGAGFIGSHMVDLLLSKDFEVRVIDNLIGGNLKNLEHQKNNPKLKFENIDIVDLGDKHNFFDGVDYIFHFAGIGDIVPSIENPRKYFENNVQGTANVLNCCHSKTIKKFVYAASSSCYGVAATPTDEKTTLNPLYPYALSKLMGEQLVLHWASVYKLPVNSLRIFNAYGTRSRTTGAYGAVFGVFLKQKLAGQPFTVVGDGSQTRDFLYVTDVAKAFLAAATSPVSNEVFNLGAGKPRSVKELVLLLDGEVVHIPKRPGEPDCTWANIEKITTTLDWQPRISLEEGVALILDDIEYWQDAPLWSAEDIKRATKSWFEFLG